jgi:hypothetical protein
MRYLFIHTPPDILSRALFQIHKGSFQICIIFVQVIWSGNQRRLGSSETQLPKSDIAVYTLMIALAVLKTS